MGHCLTPGKAKGRGSTAQEENHKPEEKASWLYALPQLTWIQDLNSSISTTVKGDWASTNSELLGGKSVRRLDQLQG
jgi:hypothetical protein